MGPGAVKAGAKPWAVVGGLVRIDDDVR